MTATHIPWHCQYGRCQSAVGQLCRLLVCVRADDGGDGQTTAEGCGRGIGLSERWGLGADVFYCGGGEWTRTTA